MEHRTRSGGWLALTAVCTVASLCCPARAAQPDGPPCQPQWVSMFSGSNALNGQVNALLVHDLGDGPALYVGGSFSIAGNHWVKKIAKWSLQGAGGWSPLGEGVQDGSGSVRSLTVFDDGVNGPQLYACGTFYQEGFVKRWTGSNWETIGAGLWNGSAGHSAVYDDGTGEALYIGGYFQTQNQNSLLLKWDGKVLSSTNIGELGFGGVLNGMTVLGKGDQSSMFISGSFSFPGAGSIFAEGDGVNWQSHWPSNGGEVGALTVFDDGSESFVYAGCYLFQGTSLVASGVAKWTVNGWVQLGSGFEGSCFAGSCNNNCGAKAPGGCWCDQACCSFIDCCPDVGLFCNYCGKGSGSPCKVHSFAAFNDGTGKGVQLHAAGSFTSMGGVEVDYIAKWDGNAWSDINGGMNQGVSALAAYQPTTGDPPILFAGGNFTNTVVGDNYLVAYVGCPTRPQCAAADINCDGSVNVADLLSVINAWGACPAPPTKCAADIAPPPDGDGQVNVADLLMIINNWG